MDIKGSDHRCSFEQVLHRLLHRVELFALVALGILSRVPEAEREDTIRLRVLDDYGLVHESALSPQNGQNLVIDGIAKLTCFSGLAGYFHNSGKHGKRSFRLVRSVKGTSRSLRGDHCLSWNATNLRWFLGSVNCPELVQPQRSFDAQLVGLHAYWWQHKTGCLLKSCDNLGKYL